VLSRAATDTEVASAVLRCMDVSLGLLALLGSRRRSESRGGHYGDAMTAA
jgi:hypothetical protein